MKYLGILFSWMKYYHIFNNIEIYDKNNIKYAILFYILKLLYPVWIIIGLFTHNIIYTILLLLCILKYLICYSLKGKNFKYYELFEMLICIVLYFILLLK